MVAFPPCKINLGLRIISKREDGFHNLETCFYSVPWTDILEIIPDKTISFTNTGIQVPGKVEDNLCLKGYELLKKEFDLPPVAIHLHKLVPMGAGLGAGSSDATATLKILSRIFSLNITEGQLTKLASKLGSDCAYFMYERPMLGTGKGDVLNPITFTLKDKFVVIVIPPVHVSTAEAYQGIIPSHPKTSIQTILENDPIENWKDRLVNDFEENIFKKYPAIAEVKSKLYAQGAQYASMSGSGSSVFGIFNSTIDLKEQFPGMTYWSGRL